MSKIKIVAVGIGAIVAAVLVIDIALKVIHPIGYTNDTRCPTIKPGISEVELISTLGKPIHIQSEPDGKWQWLSFIAGPGAAGAIRAQVLSGSRKVKRLRCSEDGPDTWTAN